MFAVHRGLICYHSSFFRATFQGRSPDSDHKSIVLPRREKQPFRTFMSWIYRMQLFDPEINFTIHDGTQYDEIVRTYIFADKRGVPSLKNAITDLLISTQIKENVLPDARLQEIWEKTPEDDGLRKLDWHVHLSLPPGIIHVDKPHRYPKDLLLRILDKVIKPSACPAFRVPADWIRLKCNYHDHTAVEDHDNERIKAED